MHHRRGIITSLVFCILFCVFSFVSVFCSSKNAKIDFTSLDIETKQDVFLDCIDSVLDLSQLECIRDKDCPYGYECRNGICTKIERVCVPGVASCLDDSTVLICSDDGMELQQKKCPPGTVCLDGKCSEECVPNCEGKECGPSNCPGYSCGECPLGYTCKEGECVEPTCQLHDTYCIDAVTVAICLEDDQSLEYECPAGFYCSNGLCISDSVCGPVQDSGCCSEDGLYLCYGGRLAYLPCSGFGLSCGVDPVLEKEWCTDVVLNEAGQVCECVPSCIDPDGTVHECGPDGCGGECGECGDGFVCTGLGRCITAECIPGQKACEKNDTLLVCSDDTGTWQPVACPPGTVCVEDDCIPASPECNPGESKCVSETSYVFCNSDGVWSESAVHCGKQQVCFNGACVTPPKSCQELWNCLAANNCQQLEDDCYKQCLEVPGTSALAKESLFSLAQCVEAFCGNLVYSGECFESAIEEACGAQLLECTGGCIPDCEGKECGSDGCGGNCGVCPPGFSCSDDFQCVPICQPDCSGKECGDDGCGGSCGQCSEGKVCSDGKCIELLDCFGLLKCGMQCSGDGCFEQQCWPKASIEAKELWTALYGCIAQQCGPNPSSGCYMDAVNGPCQDEMNACVGCTPQCAGKECGDDGCGGSCGECPAGFLCNSNGTCVCQPQCQDKECGPDGCGGSCGTCPQGTVCNYLGHCVCLPDCSGKECGDDGCGGSCGQCAAGWECVDGKCVPQDQNLCGNGICQPKFGEFCFSCPQDCGECGICGDDVCQQFNPEETCLTCPQDCGECGGDCCSPHPFPWGCSDAEVAQCVCQIKPVCCKGPWTPECVEIAKQECSLECACIPDCENKECGDDGCGGICGICPPPTICGPQQQCVQPYSCSDAVECVKECQDELGSCIATCSTAIVKPQSKMLFSKLVECVLLICPDLNKECTVGAIQGECLAEYQACLNDTVGF